MARIAPLGDRWRRATGRSSQPDRLAAAFLIARRWLGHFAYRIDMPVLAFLLATFAATAVAGAAIACT